MIRTLWEWLTTPPEIPEEYLARPEQDLELESRMNAASADFAVRRQLDFSLASLEVLDADPGEGSVIDVGAYLGQVMMRHVPGTHWARDEQGDAGIAFGPYLSDPFDQVERVRSRKPSSSFAEYVATFVAVGSAPTIAAGMKEAGLKDKGFTNWDVLVERVQRRRRQRRRP